MKIYSLTCTRSGKLSDTTSNLLEYFSRCEIESKLLINQTSIFEAYDKGLDALSADFDDIIILCHDDIQILTDPKVFTQLLREKLSKSNTGFVGVAGTKVFAKTAVWWDMDNWKAGAHSGYIFHGNTLEDMTPTYFGKLGEVVVLDGVFLAATKRTLRSIQITKPRSFPGTWDFYDIYYTFQAYTKKKKNYTLPIQIRHESHGELAGRDSWHQNRDAFTSILGKFLPASLM